MFVVPVPVSVEPFFGRRWAFKIPLAPTRGPNCRSLVAKFSSGAVEIKIKNFRLRSQPKKFDSGPFRLRNPVTSLVGCKLINVCC